MKKLFAMMVLAGGIAFAADGASIFKSKGCASCHQPKADTVGPSLKKIAKAYTGKEAELVKFLKGQAPAIIDPAKYAIMKAQLTMVKNLPEDQLKALAQYMLSFK